MYYKKHKIIDIGKHDSKSYKSHFKKGLNAMENKIIKIAEKAWFAPRSMGNLYEFFFSLSREYLRDALLFLILKSRVV